jgi:hypothetical protein
MATNPALPCIIKVFLLNTLGKATKNAPLSAMLAFGYSGVKQ